jgi:hypothetical protein
VRELAYRIRFHILPKPRPPHMRWWGRVGWEHEYDESYELTSIRIGFFVGRFAIFYRIGQVVSS